MRRCSISSLFPRQMAPRQVLNMFAPIASPLCFPTATDNLSRKSPVALMRQLWQPKPVYSLRPLQRRFCIQRRPAQEADFSKDGNRHRYRGSGAWGRIRTTDTRIFNPLLYQLSYPGPGLPRAEPGHPSRRAVYTKGLGPCPDALVSSLHPCRKGCHRPRLPLPRG